MKFAGLTYLYQLIAQNPPPGEGGAAAPAGGGQAAQQGGTAGQQAAQAPGGDSSFIFMILIMFAILYFFMIRPQNKQRKELEKQLNALQKGDRVVFGGGMLGDVVNPDAGDNVVVVKIADDVKVEILRNAITKVLAQ